MKKCSSCQEFKTTDNFSKNRAKKDGLNQECKPCSKLSHDKQREKGLTRWYDMKKKFGISKEEYLNLLEKQDYKCAICGKAHSEEKGKRLFVDHCHDTGKIRGLLCSACNVGLGHFRDSAEIIEKAIKYVEEYRDTGRKATALYETVMEDL